MAVVAYLNLLCWHWKFAIKSKSSTSSVSVESSFEFTTFEGHPSETNKEFVTIDL